MHISSRFAVGIHILTLVAINNEIPNTSEFIASSVGTNPVVIRRLLGQLKKHGLVDVAAGVGGTTLLKSPKEISLFEIYKAVEAVEAGELFAIHTEPNNCCPIGANIHSILSVTLTKAQDAMELVLKNIMLNDIVENIKISISRS